MVFVCKSKQVSFSVLCGVVLICAIKLACFYAKMFLF